MDDELVDSDSLNSLLSTELTPVMDNSTNSTDDAGVEYLNGVQALRHAFVTIMELEEGTLIQ